MSKFTFFILCAVLCTHSFHCPAQVDSIRILCEKEKNVNKKFELLVQLGNEYRSSNMDSAQFYHLKAIKWATSKIPGKTKVIAENEAAYNRIRLNELDEGKTELLQVNQRIQTAIEEEPGSYFAFHFKRSLALNYEYLGITLRKQDSLFQAIEYFDKSIEVIYQIGDLDLLSDLYNDAAQTHYMTGAFPKSLEFCLKGIKVNERRNDKQGVASSTGNTGILFKEMGEYEKALEYFKTSLQLNEELGNKRSIAINLGNIGVAYDHLDQYDLAFEHYLKAAEIHEELGSTEGLIYNYNNIGLIYETQENYEKAIEYFNKSLAFSEEIQNNYTYAHTCIYLAGSYNKLKNYKLAQDYLDKARDICIRMEALDLLVEYYEQQSDIYEKTGQYAKSLENYKSYIEIKDSLINEENLRKVIQLESNYKMDKRIAEDSLAHAKEILLNKAEADQRKAELKAAQYLQYGLAGGVLLLLISFLFIYKRFQVSKKQNRIISSQKEVLQTQKFQVESQKQVLEVKQKEIVDSINYAKRIQGAILPSAKLVKSTFPESFILYKPKDIVAGDFYWIEKQGDLTYVAAADCTGHGVPGAMVSVICHNALNRCIKEFEVVEPGEILDTAKKMINEEFEKSEEEVRDGMDIALCSLRKIDDTQVELKFAGAHNSLLIVRNGSKILEEVRADRKPVGKYFLDEPFTTHTLYLEKGDQIYLTTDGYYDQFGGEEKKKFKSLNFRNLILEISHMPMEDQLLKLDQVFENWKGNVEQIDDICVIGVRMK